MRKSPRVGITHGDINGIAGEIILKLTEEEGLSEIFTPVIFSTTSDIQRWAQALGMNPPTGNTIKNSRDIIDGRVNWVNCSDVAHNISIGNRTEEARQAEESALRKALDAWNYENIDLIVSTPGQIGSSVEIGSLSSFDTPEEVVPMTLLIDGTSRFIQLPAAASEEENADLLRHRIQEIHNALRADFRLVRPRIAVITPDASPLATPLPYVKEGETDPNVITPMRQAVLELQAEGHTLIGPLPMQQVFEQEQYAHYDACIVIASQESFDTAVEKVLSENAVYSTIGLPFVHTYPKQEIYLNAGKNCTSPDQLRNAIYTGIDICRAREDYYRYTHRPLEKQWVPRGKDDFKLDLTKEDPTT